MKYSSQLVLAFILLFPGSLMAFDFGAGTIELPRGFEAQSPKNVREQGLIYQFVKKHADSDSGTLLQITVYDFGQKLRPVPDGMLLAAAENHLMDYIAGQRRHFDTFDFKKMKSLKLGNMPAAHIEWTGGSNGEQFRGTAYSLMKGSKVITFQVRDTLEAPLGNTIAALKALASVKLND